MASFKILLLGFIDFFCLGLTMPIGGIHVMNLGGSRFLIGLLTSLHSFLQLISGPIVGSWSDSRGRKPLLLITIGLLFVANLLVSIPSLPVYIFSRLIFGVACVQILVKALITDTTPRDDQAAVFGKMGAFAALGFIVAPVLSGHIFEREFGYFYLSMILVSINLVMLLLTVIIREQPKSLEHKTDESKRSITSELSAIVTNLAEIKWSVFGDLFAIKFLAETANTTFYSTFGMIMIEVFGSTQKEIGYVIAWHSLIMVLGNVLNTTIKSKLYNKDSTGYQRNVHGLVTLTVCFLVMYLAPSFWCYVLVMVPFSIAKTVLENTWMDMLLVRCEDSEKGRVMGAFESMLQLAGLATPIMTGLVGDWYGFEAAVGLAVLPISAAAALAAYMKSKRHNMEVVKEGVKQE